MFLVRYLVTVFDASITFYSWFAENDTFEISQVSRATVGSENKKESIKELEA